MATPHFFIAGSSLQYIANCLSSTNFPFQSTRLKNFISIIFLLLCSYGNAQLRISFATDVSVMRNFSPRHQFWAIGQNLHANLHFTKKESIYTSVVYYSSGKFRNRFVATAKSPSTIPSSIAYDIKGSLRSNEFSIGLKHFWLGRYLPV